MISTRRLVALLAEVLSHLLRCLVVVQNALQSSPQMPGEAMAMAIMADWPRENMKEEFIEFVHNPTFLTIGS